MNIASTGEKAVSNKVRNGVAKCVTKKEPRAYSVSYTTAPAGTPCKFGLDPRDEGFHCVLDDGKYGSYGWCYTSTDMQSWGSCSEDCPLYGGDRAEFKAISTRIDTSDEYISGMIEDLRSDLNLSSSNSTIRNGSKGVSFINREPMCACVTPNSGSQGRNKFVCSDGTTGFCAHTETCIANSTFNKSQVSSFGCQDAMCKCTTPNEGTSGKNHFTCSDGTASYCGQFQRCVATSSFARSNASVVACKGPAPPTASPPTIVINGTLSSSNPSRSSSSSNLVLILLSVVLVAAAWCCCAAGCIWLHKKITQKTSQDSVPRVPDSAGFYSHS